MTNLTIQMPIDKESWFARRVIYFPVAYLDFFPIDALREREGGSLSGQPVIFDYGDNQITCDIVVQRDTKGQINRVRPSITGDAIHTFFQKNGAKVGDFVTLTKVEPRKFLVQLVKINGTAL